MMRRVAANKASWEQVDAGLRTKWAGVGFHALPLVSSRKFRQRPLGLFWRHRCKRNIKQMLAAIRETIPIYLCASLSLSLSYVHSRTGPFSRVFGVSFHRPFRVSLLGGRERGAGARVSQTQRGAPQQLVHAHAHAHAPAPAHVHAHAHTHTRTHAHTHTRTHTSSIFQPVFSFFASQTLHNRTNFKKKSGEVKDSVTPPLSRPSPRSNSKPTHPPIHPSTYSFTHPSAQSPRVEPLAL
jgi:hypothetical protein